MNLSVKFNLESFLATTVGHATDLDNNEDELKFYSELARVIQKRKQTQVIFCFSCTQVELTHA